MMSSILRQISGMLGICLLAATAAQAVPQKISYQGSLSDQIGQPVDGTLAMTFRLYTVPTGGSELWSETQSVQIVNGLFSVELGAQNLIPEDTFFGEEVYLGVQVGADSEMVPRQQLNAVGYSLNSPAGQIPVPIGTVLPWVKNLAGVPALPVGWLECNGQVVADSQSPLDGETLPDLNGGGYLLRGNSTSGTVDNGHTHTFTSGSEVVTGGTRVAYFTGQFGLHHHSGTTAQGGATFDVVYIIKVK